MIHSLRHPVFQWMLRGHFFISLCATALYAETRQVLALPNASWTVYGLVFFSTLLAYNIYYLKTEAFRFHAALTLVGSLGAGICFMLQHSVSILSVLATATMAILYMIPVFIPRFIILRKIKLPLLILIWVQVTFFWGLEDMNHPIFFFLYLLQRFTFLSILCMVFYVRDEVADEKRVHWIRLIQGICLLALLTDSAILFYKIETGMAFLLSLICTVWVCRHVFKQAASHEYYLLFVDGLMILQFIFVLLNKIVWE
ncbi:MAG TPA: hypothetical protein PLP34_04655 [Chitinophagaceae bacterium]|nr:hypothetical protein [Chitinophagaceae bacterium]HNF71680.1 hypothetical protein [Chitinophagaceae bacterium]